MGQSIQDIGNRCQFVPSLVGLSPSSGTIIGTLADLKDSDSYCNVWVCASPSAINSPTATISGPILIQVQCTDGVSGSLFSGGGFPPSGNFTDPTSGLTSPLAIGIGGLYSLPTWFNSGCILIVNSGLYPVIGGGFIASGGPFTAANFYQGGFPPATMPFGLTPTINAMGGGLLGVSGSAYSGFAYSGVFPRFQNGGMAIAAFQRTGQFARLILLSGGTTNVNVTAGFISQLMGGGPGYNWLPASGLSGSILGGGFTGTTAAGMPLV